jgi:hypothetical protein
MSEPDSQYRETFDYDFDMEAGFSGDVNDRLD